MQVLAAGAARELLKWYYHPAHEAVQQPQQSKTPECPLCAALAGHQHPLWGSVDRSRGRPHPDSCAVSHLLHREGIVHLNQRCAPAVPIGRSSHCEIRDSHLAVVMKQDLKHT